MVRVNLKECFSGLSSNYAKYRPSYPKELFHYLASLSSEHTLAWDCATGNGQAAVMLSSFFQQVIATDISPRQIDLVTLKPNIDYRVLPAEKTNLSPASVDLVTVAQSLYYLQLNEFYEEARRVLKPNGVLAAWCYGLPVVSPSIDALLHYLHFEVLGPFWPPERKAVDDGLQTIFFPLQRLIPPHFSIKLQWDFAYFMGYLKSWMAVPLYQKKFNKDPLSLVAEPLLAAWGTATTRKEIHWALALLVGQF